MSVTLLTYKSHQSSLAGVCVCVCGGGGGQLIYIVSPYRYVNIQSVFWGCKSRAEFGFIFSGHIKT